MKIVVLLLLALTSCVLAADTRRMRRDLFVDWLWNTNDVHSDDGESEEEVRQAPTTFDEMDKNRTPKSRCHVEGVWYNNLGSEMILNTTSEAGILIGEYRTAVERKLGSAGTGPSRVLGHTSTNGDFPTFGLSVVWRNGQSVSGWTGQCHLCDGEETLYTTWILTSHIDDCDDRWMANRIGQDTFKRYELKDGPRRDENTHTPSDFARRREQEMQDGQPDQ